MILLACEDSDLFPSYPICETTDLIKTFNSLLLVYNKSYRVNLSLISTD
jgi:hypothetical protein